MTRHPLSSIQRTLQVSFALTLGFATLVMGGVWISSDQSLLEHEAKRVLTARADIVGIAARPALLFSDRRLANKLLLGLKSNTDITRMCLFTADGKTLADVIATGNEGASVRPVPFETSDFHMLGNRMELYEPIVSDGTPIGVVYIESNLDTLSNSERTSIITISLVMAFSLILALIIAMGLQRKITSPIVSLARLMRRASEEQDYSQRHSEVSNVREIDDLLSGYNAMIQKVEEGFVAIENSQRQLRESERRFRIIAEATPLPIIISRPDELGSILFINRAALQLMADNHHPQALTGTAMLYKNPGDRQRILELVSTQGALHAYELPLSKLDGSTIWVELSIVPIRFEDEPGMFGTFVDITERRLVQQTLANVNEELEKRVLDRTLALQEANRQLLASQKEIERAHNELQSTLDNMLDTYYRFGPDGMLAWTSKSVQNLTGYAPEELPSIPVDRIFAEPADLRAFRVAFERSNGSLINYETRLRRKDGRVIWVSGSAKLIHKPGKEQGGVEGVIRDITAQIEAKEQKADMERRMAHVQRLESLGVLAGGIAHDFNNLLSAILGNAELMRLKLDGESEVDKEIGSITVSCERAADLCRQMLAYSGQGKTIVEAVNLSELVEETAQLLDVFVSKKTALDMRLDPALPAVDADRTQLQQIVMNLITNASEAIGDGPGKVSILTRCIDAKADDLRSEYIEDTPPPGRYICLEVRDTGCGMDKATMHRIFDPFFSTKFTGRGLGMSAVLGIVRSHHGSIRINSRPGAGTTIRVLLPASPFQEQVPAPRPDAKRRDAKRPADNEGQRPATVLLVDDEHMVRSIVKSILERMGYTVLTAENGVECIEVFRKFHKDVAVVLLDLTMPLMDGRETFHRLHAIDPDVKVILSSGYSREEAFQHFKDISPAGFLQKPYLSKPLQQAIRDVIGRT
ncbi:MAG TPA: PAS domain S-box protein [Mariprofundaceae bacterium]|nr:PAS domain S-box protein [Mariprofundaceae bacterium]